MFVKQLSWCVCGFVFRHSLVWFLCLYLVVLLSSCDSVQCHTFSWLGGNMADSCAEGMGSLPAVSSPVRLETHLDIGTEEESIHQQDRAAQVTIFRQKSGHCQLLSHLYRLKISHSDECPFGTGPQTPDHILQSCPHIRCFDTPDMAHSSGYAHRKHWELVETMQQTADFALLTGLKIWHGRELQRRRRRSVTEELVLKWLLYQTHGVMGLY